MKTSRTLSVLAGSFLLLVFLAAPLRGVVPITWKGGLGSPVGTVAEPTNWNGVLLKDGSDDVTFDTSATDANVYIPDIAPDVVGLHNITFDSSSLTFNFHGNGTTSYLVLDGTLTATASSNAVFHNDLAIKLTPGTHTADVGANALITIASNLSDYAAASSISKTGDGKLELSGANSFTGGVTLNAGYLLLGNSTALGTTAGTLTLNGGTLAPTANITLANNVTLNSSIKLGDCDTSSSISFTGTITGTGAFDTHGTGDITFSGNNSGWSGGLSLYGANNVFVNQANGLGTGPVYFEYNSTSALHFNESATISRLEGGYFESVWDGESYNDEGSAVILAATKTLTINQGTDTEYWGKIYGTGDGGLSKLGNGSLTLGGPVGIDGAVNVTSGTLKIDGDNGYSFSSGAINVGNGATLALSNSAWVYSTASIASGGTLSGNGHIANATIQAGAILSPGTAACPIGEITFEDLTLMGQSTIVVGVKSDGSGNLENSTIRVENTETLTLSGIDATHTLSLKLISDGLLGGLVENQPYTVSFLHFQNQTGLLTNANVDFTLSTLDTGFANVTYSIALVGNDYVVTFTPVPEPSTYALMALGLMGTGLAAWRKRRRA